MTPSILSLIDPYAARNTHHDITWRTRLTYTLSKWLGRHIRWACLQIEVIRPELADRNGGYLLACTHLSHLEPFLASLLTHRQVDWMARIEFFRWRLFAWYLKAIGSFAVNRQGVPVSAIRTAIARASQGRVVGICPEGGVLVGGESVCRGGAIKRGICLIAARSRTPIVPCVILGTHTLNRVRPWVPIRRGKLWAAFGEAVWPETDVMDRKAARARLAQRLEKEYVRLYQELLGRYGIDDGRIP